MDKRTYWVKESKKNTKPSKIFIIMHTKNHIFPIALRTKWRIDIVNYRKVLLLKIHANIYCTFYQQSAKSFFYDILYCNFTVSDNHACILLYDLSLEVLIYKRNCSTSTSRQGISAQTTAQKKPQIITKYS